MIAMVQPTVTDGGKGLDLPNKVMNVITHKKYHIKTMAKEGSPFLCFPSKFDPDEDFD